MTENEKLMYERGKRYLDEKGDEEATVAERLMLEWEVSRATLFRYVKFAKQADLGIVPTGETTFASVDAMLGEVYDDLDLLREQAPSLEWYTDCVRITAELRRRLKKWEASTPAQEEVA